MPRSQPPPPPPQIKIHTNRAAGRLLSIVEDEEAIAAARLAAEKQATPFRVVDYSSNAGQSLDYFNAPFQPTAETQETLAINPTAKAPAGRRKSSIGLDVFGKFGGFGRRGNSNVDNEKTEDTDAISVAPHVASEIDNEKIELADALGPHANSPAAPPAGRRKSSLRFDPFTVVSGSRRATLDNIDPTTPLDHSVVPNQPLSVHVRSKSVAPVTEEVKDVLLVNPLTGERRRSVIRTQITTPEPNIIPGIRRPSIMASPAGSRKSSTHTLVRRDSEAAVRHIHRQSLSASRRSSLLPQSRTMSMVATPGRQNSLFAPQLPAPILPTPRSDSDAASDPFADPATANPSPSPTPAETPARRKSVWQEGTHALFGAFSMGRKSSTAAPEVLPTQEPVRTYNDEFGSGIEMIEVPVDKKPNTGWISRRASIAANIFTDKDIDVDPDLELRPDASDAEIDHAIGEASTARGNRKMLWSRNLAIFLFWIMNGGLIAVCFGLKRYWYVLIPLVVFGSLVNSVMVLNLTRIFLMIKTKRIYQKVARKEEEVDITPTTMMTVIPCYNESYEELMGTLDSIENSKGIDMHNHMIVIVCDGKVTGKGQAKSTPRILMEDILTDNNDEVEFTGAYRGWTQDHERNTLWCRRGYYKGIPYILTVKQNNRGKRDGLIMIRNLLYAYNNRETADLSYFSSEFFDWCAEWAQTNRFPTIDWLVGTDADTLFDPGCIAELYRQCLLDPSCVGTCGLIKVGFRTGNWTFWNLFQNAEYIRGQMLRRLHQSYATHRVTCLPGACQIIKVCEQTCGPKIMDELFGYYPRPMDHLIQKIRSLAGEDRNYVVNMFWASPQINTRQAIHAVAYTDPPTSLSVFLSQRRRWTLSTCANDIIVIRDPKMKWWERVSSIADLLTWFLPIFILATVANFLRAVILHHNVPLLVGLSSVVFLPWLYTFVSVLWVPRTMTERLQYALGLVFLAVLGPFMTALVIAYAIANSHVFGWGKTRQLAEGDENKAAH